MNSYVPVFILNELIILPNQEIKIDITNTLSKKIIKSAGKNNYNKILVIAPKNVLESEPSLEDLPSVGVIAKIKSKIELPNGNLRVILRGSKRVRIVKYFQNKSSGILKCSNELIELPNVQSGKESAIKRKLISILKEYITVNKEVSNSILKKVNDTEDLDSLTDIIASFLPFNFSKKLDYMICINPVTRASKLINDINEEINICNIDKELNEKLQDNIENGQREYILKEKLKEINKELGYTKEEEIISLKDKVNNLNLREESKNKLLNEIDKYSNASDYSPESSVIKNYLDTVINLPWDKYTELNLNINKIKTVLNESHFGLDNVKDRIVEYATLLKCNKSLKAPVIALVGAPGTGKTSIAYSIASALNRKFYKISVGGLNDSTELIGSRKTYLGASPGKIMQGIIKCNVNNPLILIDEVDKMVKDYKGDPASTLLEILDEVQNKDFIDNYIEEPFDLSNVMFILTANNEEDIPYTLLDRLEVIKIDSYLISQKIILAKNYLIKNILKEYNVDLKISKEVIEYIILNYTKEPGVRELKKVLEKLIRKMITYEPNIKTVTIMHVSKYLDEQTNNYLPEIITSGVANVLAYTSNGGKLSRVEVVKYKGTGKVNITGLAGDALKESAQVVISYLTNKYNLDLKGNDTHIHFVPGADKKDGPSAGVSMAACLMSLKLSKKIAGSIAFTGELSLNGDILPVGGIKEKLTCAYYEGIKKVFVPSANILDVQKVPSEITNNIEIIMVNNFSQIYDVIFK